MPTASILVDRFFFGAAIVLTAVLFTAQAADPVNIIKMVALVLCTVAVLTGCAVRAIRTREPQLPWGWPAAVGAVLLAAFALAAATAPVTGTALYGAYGRNSGLIVYACAVALFLAGLRIFDRDGTRTVLYALLLAGMFTATYGLLQYTGHDSVPWNNPFNPIIGALGNPNFAAAYVAICSPAAVWGALRTGWPLAMRVLSGVVAALCLLAAYLSDAAQGPLAAGPGLAVLAVAWLLDRPKTVRRAGLAAVGFVGALGTAALLAGARGVGPAAGVFQDAGSRARGYYWEAALTLWREHPVLGVGLDNFGSFWRTARSVEATRALGGDDFTDAAHSVPLHLLSTGGIVLALAYIAFVTLVGVSLILGLRRLRGQERLLLGALGGSWTAYQVQSLVSIDQVPLLVTQYALASAVVVASGMARTRDVRLPGALPVPLPTAQRTRRQKQAASLPRVRALTSADQVGLGLVGVVALILAWQALDPLRASAAAADGDAALAAGDLNGALASYERATELMPSSPAYLGRVGKVHAQAGREREALQALRAAEAADPYDINVVRQAATATEAQGDVEEARRLHRRALELDPRGPSTVISVAAFELRHGEPRRARALLEELVVVLPRRAEAWTALGDARAATQDPAAARAAYTTALQLAPEDPTAKAGLAKLDGATT